MSNTNIQSILLRNNLSFERYLSESYNSLLFSLFQCIADDLTSSKEEFRKCKLKYLNSSNEKVVTKNIVKEYTNCLISDEEASIIHQWFVTYFTKDNKRIDYDNKVRIKLLDSQDHKCKICSKLISINDSELDHILPWSYVGDKLGINNLQLLCRNCNRHKSKSAVYNLKMFLIKNKAISNDGLLLFVNIKLLLLDTFISKNAILKRF